MVFQKIILRIYLILFLPLKPQGTGLGLSVSYDIIRDHGGDIEVKSELDKGTTFTINLPIKTE